MTKDPIAPSELIINSDGSAFHLHLLPSQLSRKVILVGDPGRVALVAGHFENIECDVTNREFRTITGYYKGKRVTCLSTGIGCDNIDIVLNEIDALANVDFVTRKVKDETVSLDIVRVGTTGGLQIEAPVGSFVISQISVGFDGVLDFYKGNESVSDLELEKALTKHLGWDKNIRMRHLYAVPDDKDLVDRIARDDMLRGITVSANGFYGPQGRSIRLPLSDPDQNLKLESFRYGDLNITNFEMEGSALAGLSRLMGHHAATVCLVLANRHFKEADPGVYSIRMDELIQKVLDRI